MKRYDEIAYSNLLTMAFDGVGPYDIPQIEPVYEVGDIDKWIGFNFANTNKKDRKHTGVHFYVDDYRFERVWNFPKKYVALLKQFGTVMTPDFSTYLDFPEAIRIYNHYRRHWCGAFWQEMGLNVIPNIQWGRKDSYSWCFDGDPKGGIVAVSNVGMRKNKENRQVFMDGYKEMLIRLQPKEVLVFGRSFDDYPGPTRYIEMELHKGDQGWETKQETTDYLHKIA